MAILGNARFPGQAETSIRSMPIAHVHFEIRRREDPAAQGTAD